MNPLSRLITDRLNVDVETLRATLRQDRSEGLRRRRSIIGLSLVGMASMATVSLFQTGLIRHLPDPPLKRFHSDKVNASDDAYQFGVPDGTLSLADLASNVPLAAFGGADRARKQPWVPLLAAGKAAAGAVTAGWYFYRMPAKEHAWCGFCIAGALVNAGIFALTLPEARQALSALREKS